MADNNKSNVNQVDFSALILGFSSAALMYLGEQPKGEVGSPAKNLALARQNIDIILLLREKTRGNLTAEEVALTEQLVHDLQLKFIAASKAI